jgi:recombination protein RecA
MTRAAAIRLQVESALARKIPSALTPPSKMVRPVVETGIASLDTLLQGGIPIGAVSEFIGPECSGRTSVALSFLARITQADKVCAWIDVSNTFDPESAAALGVDLRKLLWVRCGVDQATTVRRTRRFQLAEKYFDPRPIKKGLHGGGFGPHPRTEVHGLSNAIGDLFAPRCAEPKHKLRARQENVDPAPVAITQPVRVARRARQYDAIEQGIRSADLLMQTGGFGAIVLDLGSIAPEYVARVELSTWHRYRLAAESTQGSILLLTQYPCAKSSSELQLRFSPDERTEDTTVFNGMRFHAEVMRQRFTQTQSNVIPMRKPPQGTRTACCESRTTWAVRQ